MSVFVKIKSVTSSITDTSNILKLNLWSRLLLVELMISRILGQVTIFALAFNDLLIVYFRVVSDFLDFIAHFDLDLRGWPLNE